MDADRAAANPEEIAALVAGSPFAERLARGAPTLVFAGQSPRLFYASPAALELFGAASPGELEALLLAAASPGARRLAGLAQAGAGGPPRVESLRFYVNRRPLPLALLCGRIGDHLVVSTPPGPDEIAAPTLAPIAARARAAAAAPLSLEPRPGGAVRRARSGARRRLRPARAPARRTARDLPRARRLRPRRPVRANPRGATHLRGPAAGVAGNCRRAAREWR